MGRKRSAGTDGGDTVPLGDAVDHHMCDVVPGRVSILQAMCAAAVPHEHEMGRQDLTGVSTLESMALQVEEQFPGGMSNNAQNQSVYANSLLRTGHFVSVNNELARQRRTKEAFSQFTGDKVKERSQVTTLGVAQKGDGGMATPPARQRPSTKKDTIEPPPEPVSAGVDDRSGQGKPNRNDKSRQGMKQALKLARAPNDLKKAKECFRRKFLAAGTLLAKNAKRRKGNGPLGCGVRWGTLPTSSGDDSGCGDGSG